MGFPSARLSTKAWVAGSRGPATDRAVDGADMGTPPAICCWLAPRGRRYCPGWGWSRLSGPRMMMPSEGLESLLHEDHNECRPEDRNSVLQQSGGAILSETHRQPCSHGRAAQRADDRPYGPGGESHYNRSARGSNGASRERSHNDPGGELDGHLAARCGWKLVGDEFNEGQKSQDPGREAVAQESKPALLKAEETEEGGPAHRCRRNHGAQAGDHAHQ